MTRGIPSSRFRPQRASGADQGAHRGGGAAAGRRSLAVGLGLALILAGSACESTPATPAVDRSPPTATPTTIAAPTATPGPAETPWRMIEVLRAHLGPEVPAAPIYEAVDDLHGEARVAVVVYRADRANRAAPAAPLGIELWRLRSGGPEAIFAPVDEAQPLLRLRADDPPAPELDRLRRFAATPGTALLRPRGVGDSPEALLVALTEAARASEDPAASGEARTRALAAMIRGLDDPLVLEQDQIFAALAAFAGGPLTIAVRRPIGARRMHLETAGPGALALELTALKEGWVLSEIGPLGPGRGPADQGASGSIEPAAEPSPTAP